MIILRLLFGIVLGFVSFLAGCGGSLIKAMYGVELMYGPPSIPRTPHDPTVTLDEFSYAPPGPANPGDKLEFSATTNKATDAGWIYATVGDPPVYGIALNDLGLGGDAVADDGIWHGEWVIQEGAPPAIDLPVKAEIRWEDGYPGQELAGEDLTITDGDA